MIRTWGKWAVLLAGLFVGCIFSAHVLPISKPDTQAFRTVFLESCAAPCLMGIQPQFTTLTEALAILGSHEWVREVKPEWDLGLFAQDAIVIWEWSGAQPAIIDGSRPGSLIATAPLGSRRHIVERINVLTTLPMYDLQMALREEPTGYVRYVPADDVVLYGLRVGDETTPQTITLSTQIACPARLMAYSRAAALVSISGQVSRGRDIPPSTLNSLCHS